MSRVISPYVRKRLQGNNQISHGFVYIRCCRESCLKSRDNSFELSWVIYVCFDSVMAVLRLPITRMILGLRSANERRRYKVTPSLIGQAQT